MLSRAPVRFRRRPPRIREKYTFEPLALALVAAEYESAAWVQLTFNQAIDIAGLVGGQITVSDPDATAVKYEAVGTATLMSPTTVRIELLEIGPVGGEGVTLSVGAGNGIVAVSGGTPWGGCERVGIALRDLGGDGQRITMWGDSW